MRSFHLFPFMLQTLVYTSIFHYTDETAARALIGHSNWIVHLIRTARYLDDETCAGIFARTKIAIFVVRQLFRSRFCNFAWNRSPTLIQRGRTPRAKWSRRLSVARDCGSTERPSKGPDAVPLNWNTFPVIMQIARIIAPLGATKYSWRFAEMPCMRAAPAICL